MDGYQQQNAHRRRCSPTTIAVFEAVLADAFKRGGSTGLSLAWSNYRPGSDRRVTEHSLT